MFILRPQALQRAAARLVCELPYHTTATTEHSGFEDEGREGRDEVPVGNVAQTPTNATLI